MTENKNDTDSKDCVFLRELVSERAKPWMQNIKLNGENVDFKLDTGADVTSIPEKMYRPNRDNELQKPRKKLLGPGNYPLKV